MVTFKKMRIYIILVLVFGVAFSSCTTDEYDLSKGLNTDMTIGGDSLTIPIGKTDSIFLGKLISGQNLSILKKSADSTYSISMGDSLHVALDAISPVSFSIADITIPKISTSFSSVTFPSFQFNPITLSSDLPIPDLTIANKTVSSIHTDFDIANTLTIPVNPGPVSFNTGNLSYSSGVKHIAQNMDLTGLPSVLKSINEIQFTSSSVTLTFNKTKINSIGFDQQTDKITSFNITFPPSVTLTSANGTGTAISSDGHSFTITNAQLSPTSGIYTASFVIQKLVPPAIANSELHYSSDVTYSIDYTFNGTINDISTKNYTYPKELDLGINVKLDADPTIGNMSISTNTFDVAVNSGKNLINKAVANIPDAISKVTSLTFVNGAELALDISDPNVSPFQFSSGNCLIQLPRSIVFKSYPNLNTTTNILTIPYTNLFGSKTIGISGITLNKTVTGNSINIADSLKYSIDNLKIGDATSDLFTLQGIQGKKLNITANINNLNIQDANIETNSISLPIPNQTTNIDINQSISTDVTKIYSVALKTPTTLTFGINISNLPTNIDSIFFDNYTITLPSMLKFKTGDVNSNNQVILNRGFKVSQGFTKTLTLEGFDFGTNGIALTNGVFTLHEGVSMSGGAHIKGTNLKSSDIGSVDVQPTIAIGTMAISVIQGKIAPVIKPISEPIKLDLPAMLKDSGNNLDIKNPIITLQIGNTMGIPIDLALNLIPKSNGVAIPNSTISTTLHIAAATVLGQSTWSKYRLCAIATGISDDYNEITIANLPNLLKTVPDSIEINAVPTITGDRQIVDLYSPKNQLDIKYNVTIPLDFGADFKIQFNDTISGLQSSLKSILDLTRDFSIQAIVKSTIPMNLNFGLTPLDTNGQVITGVEIAADTIKYDNTTPINFGLKETVPGALDNLDKFIIKIGANKNVGLALLPIKADQYLIVELKAKLPNGITLKSKK